MARRTRSLLALVLLVATVAAARAPAVRAQIDPGVRDAAVAAAVQVAIDADWVENDFSMPLPLSVGSGTVVSPSGLVLTNAHVIDRAGIARQVAEIEAFIQEDLPGVEVAVRDDRFVILVSDGVHPPEPAYLASVAAVDADADLAVLRIEARDGGSRLPAGFALPSLPLGDSDALGLGDPLHIFGYPSSGGDALTYTAGVVSGFNFAAGIDGPAWINTDAVISGGSSGGTAVNAQGELVGVPTQGSTLDCRPGDTDGDGEVTPEDVGCIPTGGSIGQLRPVNLAKPLLAEAGAATPPSTEATATPRPQPTATPRPAPTSIPDLEPPVTGILDLPALVLTPDDLDGAGLPGYEVGLSQLATPEHLGALVLGPMSGPTAPSRMAGTDPLRVYTVGLAAPTEEGAGIWDEGAVAVALWEFPSEQAASTGYFTLSPAWSDSVELATAQPVGDQSLLESSAYTTGDGRDFRDVTMTFQQGAIVAVVNAYGPAANAIEPEVVERLAERLAGNLDAAAPVAAPLSASVARFEDGGGIGTFDAYLLLDGAFRQPTWIDNAFDGWRSDGAIDTYNYTLWLPTTPGPSTTLIDVNIVRFTSERHAAAWMEDQPTIVRASGATNVEEVANLPAWGDERAAFTYTTDWWPDDGPEHRLMTLVRDGDRVAYTVVASLNAFDPADFAGVAEAQAGCLSTGCAEVIVPLPAEASAVASAGIIAEPTPTPEPQPTATPRPRPTIAPTAVPAFGVDEGFDTPIDGWVHTDENGAGSFENGRFTLSVFQSGTPNLFTFDALSSEGRDISWYTRVAETSGAGAILMFVESQDDGAEWFFAIDPVNRTWSLYRLSVLDEYFIWVEPRPYSTNGGPMDIEVRVVNGVPTLLIDGVDVVRQGGVPMPDIGRNVSVGFGVGIDPAGANGWSTFFSASFDRIAFYELP